MERCFSGNNLSLILKSHYVSLLKKARLDNEGEGNGTPLQYFGHLMRRVDSLEKTLILGGIGGRRRRGRQRMR